MTFHESGVGGVLYAPINLSATSAFKYGLVFEYLVESMAVWELTVLANSIIDFKLSICSFLFDVYEDIDLAKVPEIFGKSKLIALLTF